MRAWAIMSLKKKLAAIQLAQMTPGTLPSELQMNRHWSLSGPDFWSLCEERHLRCVCKLQRAWGAQLAWGKLQPGERGRWSLSVRQNFCGDSCPPFLLPQGWKKQTLLWHMQYGEQISTSHMWSDLACQRHKGSRSGFGHSGGGNSQTMLRYHSRMRSIRQFHAIHREPPI